MPISRTVFPSIPPPHSTAESGLSWVVPQSDLELKAISFSKQDIVWVTFIVFLKIPLGIPLRFLWSGSYHALPQMQQNVPGPQSFIGHQSSEAVNAPVPVILSGPTLSILSSSSEDTWNHFIQSHHMCAATNTNSSWMVTQDRKQ